MKTLGKRIAVIAAVATMAVTSLAGCAGKVNNSEVIATVADKEITAGVANFFLRYQQASVEGYYGAYTADNFWLLTDEAGVTNEESFRKEVIASLQELYLLEAHMPDYQVTVSDDELAKVKTAADTFLKENDDKKVKDAISGDPAVVEEVLRLLLIGEKMDAAIKADVDKNVKDEEAAQKSMNYVTFKTKEEADTFLTDAKANGDLEAYAKTKELTPTKLSFDAKSTTLAADVIKAADALNEKDFSAVVEADGTFYVMQLTSKFDKDATESKKADIIAEREKAKYTEVVDGWKKATDMTVNEKVLEKIDVAYVKVTAKTEEVTQ